MKILVINCGSSSLKYQLIDMENESEMCIRDRIAVDRELRARNLKSRIVLQIHDELLIETAEDEIGAVKEILVDKMKHAADLKVSLEVEAEVGRSWFDAK